METLKKILKPVGVIMGGLMVIGGYILQAWDIFSLGLPVWAWQAIGAVIFFVSIVALIFGQEKKIEALSKPPTVIDGGKLQTPTSVLGEMTWLDAGVYDQRHSPQRYLHPFLSRLFVSTSSELGVEVDWLNCSIFDLEFTSLSGEFHINNISVGHMLKLRDKPSCSRSSSCKCTFDIMVDASVIKIVEEAKAKASAVKCGLVLNWEASPTEISKPFLKPFIKQWSAENILTVPH